MPQLTSVVLKDNANTDQTFAPKGIVSGVATLVKSNGVPVGNQILTMAHSRTQTGREKISIKVKVPVIQDVVVGGISRPTEVRASFADIVLTFDGTSSTAERADTLAYVKSLMATTFTRSVVVDLEDIY